MTADRTRSLLRAAATLVVAAACYEAMARSGIFPRALLPTLPKVAATLANPFPTGLIQPVGTSVGLLAQIGDTLSFFDDKRVNPYNQQWNFTIQQQLPSEVLLEIGYVGASAHRIQQTYDINTPPPGPGAVNSRRPVKSCSQSTW